MEEEIKRTLKHVFILLMFLNFSSFAGIIEVCQECSIKKILDAIKVAKDGDTIIVKGGLYREGTLKISKSVKLKGINLPTIDGEGKYEVIKITADNVVIEGFKIVNSGVSEIEDIAGLKVENAKNCVIRNNVFENNFWAIYLSAVKGCLIEGNKIKGPYREGETRSGNGIHLWHSKNVIVRNNYITGHRDAIYLEFVENSLIEGNLSERNWRYGVHFMFSKNNAFRGNVFRRNGVGASVMYTKKVEIRENRFEYNWGPFSYGMLLKAFNDGMIRNNVFFKNTAGILMDECQRSEITENDFIENGWALRIWANSEGNRIYKNNFINNTFDVTTNSTSSNNVLEENFWSSYRGFDLNGDGIGDVPYKPVKLFSYIVENNPSAVILLKSFFIEILNLVEENMPVIISVDIEDKKPLMKKVDWR